VISVSSRRLLAEQSVSVTTDITNPEGVTAPAGAETGATLYATNNYVVTQADNTDGNAYVNPDSSLAFNQQPAPVPATTTSTTGVSGASISVPAVAVAAVAVAALL